MRGAVRVRAAVAALLFALALGCALPVACWADEGLALDAAEKVTCAASAEDTLDATDATVATGKASVSDAAIGDAASATDATDATDATGETDTTAAVDAGASLTATADHDTDSLFADAAVASNDVRDSVSDALRGALTAAPDMFTVADGTYEIAPLGSYNQRFEATSHASSPVVLWHDHASQAQKWQVTAVGDGAYRIVSIATGKALDVLDPLGGDGTALTQRDPNSSPSQLWVLRPGSTGALQLQNVFTGRYVDVPSANYGDAVSSLHQWHGYGPVQQNFYLVSASVVDDGYYTITWAESGLSLVGDASVSAASSGSGFSMSWEVKNQADGSVVLKSAESLLLLGWNGSGAVLGSEGADDLRASWYIAVDEFGRVSIVSAASSSVALRASGSNVVVGSGSASALSRWVFSPSSLLTSGGYYALLVDGGGAVGLSSWSQDDGAYFYVYDGYWDGDALRYVVHAQDDNRVAFQNCFSGSYLTADGTSIRQYAGDGVGAAAFRVVSLGHGKLAFVAENGLVLSVWGTDIGLSAMGSGARQAFSLEAVAGLTPQEKIDRLFAAARAEVGNTNGRKYEYALLEAGGSLCYTWDYWCATYVWWAFREAGLSQYLCAGSMTVYPQQQAGFYEDRNSFGWSPKPGDLAFYYFVPFPGGEYITHTEIVLSVDWEAGTVTTIGGNPIVGISTRSIWDWRCRGYAGLNWGV